MKKKKKRYRYVTKEERGVEPDANAEQKAPPVIIKDTAESSRQTGEDSQTTEEKPLYDIELQRDTAESSRQIVSGNMKRKEVPEESNASMPDILHKVINAPGYKLLSAVTFIIGMSVIEYCFGVSGAYASYGLSFLSMKLALSFVFILSTENLFALILLIGGAGDIITNIMYRGVTPDVWQDHMMTQVGVEWNLATAIIFQMTVFIAAILARRWLVAPKAVLLKAVAD